VTFEQIQGLAIGTVLAIAVFAGLFYLKWMLRSRLFSDERARDRGEAMAELYLLRAKLEGKAGAKNTDESGNPTQAGNPGEDRDGV